MHLPVAESHGRNDPRKNPSVSLPRQLIAHPAARGNHRQKNPSTKNPADQALLPLPVMGLPVAEGHARKAASSMRNPAGGLPQHPSAHPAARESQGQKKPSAQKPAGLLRIPLPIVGLKAPENPRRNNPKSKSSGRLLRQLIAPLPAFSSRSSLQPLARKARPSSTALLWPISIIPWSCR